MTGVWFSVLTMIFFAAVLIEIVHFHLSWRAEPGRAGTLAAPPASL